MKKLFSIRIIGKVQGVFYRASACDVAKSLGLVGLVRNEMDGSVYVEVAGDAESLTKFIDWCKQGPPKAKVDHLIVDEIPMKEYTNFVIQR